MTQRCASPSLGTKRPKHWVMVPQSFHDDVDLLNVGVQRPRVEVLAHPRSIMSFNSATATI